MKIQNTKVIDVYAWNDTVSRTYGRIYNFQQQEGGKGRGTFELIVPIESTDDEGMNDSIPEKVNGEVMGVKFAAWLARDPTQKLPGQEYDFELELFWCRNFYPDIHEVANDLHQKGLLDAGEYLIKY